MTRTNAIGRLSFNSSDESLLGFILTRQPAIWMGDWGEVRVPVAPSRITELRATPYMTKVATADGRSYSLAAKASGGKVAFRGFKGRYRLSWKGADGKECFKFVEVR